VLELIAEDTNAAGEVGFSVQSVLGRRGSRLPFSAGRILAGLGKY